MDVIWFLLKSVADAKRYLFLTLNLHDDGTT